MKRTISILVIVAMMLASLLAIVPVSAAEPEGTPVKNAKEFAAMDATGTYYLADDITISAPSADFKGTLDGNGHTISNLKITGYKSTVGFFANTYNGAVVAIF